MMDAVVALPPTPGLTAGAYHPIYKKPELLAQDACSNALQAYSHELHGSGCAPDWRSH
jgi:hypothetical protein